MVFIVELKGMVIELTKSHLQLDESGIGGASNQIISGVGESRYRGSKHLEEV